MYVSIGGTLDIRNPTDDIKKWVKENLTLINPEYLKKMRMHLYLGKTERILKLYEEIGDRLILPYGCLTLIPQKIKQFDFAIKTFTTNDENTNINYGANFELYPYQEKAVNVMVDKGMGILQAPTGCGKTQMGLALATKLQCRTLWITHTKDLLKQSYDRASQYMSKDLLGTITDGKVKIGKGITFATIQTLAKIDVDKYRDCWNTIIIDEVHRVAGSPTRLTQYKYVLDRLKAEHKYGLSATVHRADGMITCTFSLVGKVEHVITDDEVAKMKVPIKVKIFNTRIGMPNTKIALINNVINTDGTLNYQGMLNWLSLHTQRNQIILSLLDTKHSTLVLSARVDQIEYLYECLDIHQKARARIITGKTKKKDREQAIEDMRNRKINILFSTYQLAKEGLDIPCLDRLVFATPEKDYSVITQSIGRVSRKYKEKSVGVVFDLIDDIEFYRKWFHKRRVIYKKNGYSIENGYLRC